MIFDRLNLFSDDQAITATAASTNVVDTGAIGTDAPIVGNHFLGDDAKVEVIVTAAFNNLTNLAIAFQCDADEAFGSPTTLSTTTVLLAGLVQGYKLTIAIPVGCERYVRMYYTVAGSAPSTGTITAGITPSTDINI